MNPSESYVDGLLRDLKRLREQEMKIIEKLVMHFEQKDKGLHDRYVKLDTEVVQLGEKIRNAESH